ncbi:MAG: hypothetical protein ACI857_002045 [Arenicella sp.]|jgi:hypothetical protein
MRLFLLLSCVFSLNAALSETVHRDYWYVVSDQAEDSIPANVCLITGHVTEVWGEKAVPNGIISNLDRSSNTKTDEKGYFELTISIKDTALFFFHEQYAEIVCWNYDFKGGHHVVMNFVTSEKLPNGMQVTEEKPVIYAYSEKDISASFKLSNADSFTFTYPEYKESWEVEIKANKLFIEDEQYPYLFWEGKNEGLKLNSKTEVLGYKIDTDNCVEMLESALTDLNFNAQEKTDFITYWAPRITKYPYAEIQFLIDSEYNETIGRLNVDPKPDSQRRVFMIFKGSDVLAPYPVYEAPEFESFKRVGFHILEWGGAEITPTKAL